MISMCISVNILIILIIITVFGILVVVVVVVGSDTHADCIGFYSVSTLEVPFASVPSVIRVSAVPRFSEFRKPRYLRRFLTLRR